MATRRLARALVSDLDLRSLNGVAWNRTDPFQRARATEVVRRTLKTHSDAAVRPGEAVGREVIYRCAWIRPIRLLVRLKVLQLCGVGAAMVPLSAELSNKAMNTTMVLVSSGVVVGAAVASLAMWYYSRRFVGELALVEDRTRLRVSTLDFWGRRQEEELDLASLIPPFSRRSTTTSDVVLRSSFVPLQAMGGRQYMLAWRVNAVPSDLLLRVLVGEPLRGASHAPVAP